MSRESVSLSDVLIEAKPGFACGEDDPDGVFQFRMNNITTRGTLDLSKRRRVPRDIRRLDTYLLTAGDVLFNATNSPELVGKSAYVPEIEEPAVFSNHFLRLRSDPSRLDGKYLAHWLNLQFQRGVFAGMCRQWVNQATVGRESFLALAIPLPSITEQRRIAEVLDRAEEMRAKRRSAIARLSCLGEAIFLDMFGDPAANPRGWRRRRISDIGDVTTGNTPPRENAALFGQAIEWIKSDNLAAADYYATRAAEGLSTTGKALARTAPVGSILVTCIAGSPDSIGNAAMLDREVAFNQQINALTPHSANPHFVFAQIRVGKRLIQEASTGGMKGLVSKSRFGAVTLIVPPQALQEQFAVRALVLQGLKQIQRTALAESDTLFRSLQARAFAGSL